MLGHSATPIEEDRWSEVRMKSRRLLQQSRQNDDGELGEEKWKNGVEIRNTQEMDQS